jgi:hypothetical protein
MDRRYSSNFAPVLPRGLSRLNSVPVLILCAFMTHLSASAEIASCVPHPSDETSVAPERTAERRSTTNWLRLSPTEQSLASRSDKCFNLLSPQQQEHFLRVLRRFNALPQDQKDRLLRSMMADSWHLSSEQGRRAAKVFDGLRELSPERRVTVLEAIHGLGLKPLAEREAIINSEKFRASFSPAELSVIHMGIVP